MKADKTRLGLPIHYYNISQNRYIWFTFESSLPIWWVPRLERYSYGIRVGFLIFAVGFGIVNESVIDFLIDV
ncbi:hypothetical protein [Thermoanaerobacterium sp. RBIITD]|uniref:hypothetical protein n=1 Tax=Thermoanaerobacterium sp. RBIITD TaxID=1550240 RepID=UPI000BB7D25C|nr:hypothetical protein [Thermoanaerobacterium sp. RBIITD]SNX54202.1 hypothetical protein SAMN05660242_1838 [Thermoanaerobacterium sp. RBIITD]